MAALLRHGAARRLDGSVLQRTKAALTSPAVAEERRRLVPRRMLSNGQVQPVDVVRDILKTEEALNTKKTVDREEALREIQKLKEKAYDALAMGEGRLSTFSLRNHLLLQHLAVQISPRPGDLQWRCMYFARKALTVLEMVALISLAATVFGVARYIRKGSNDKTRLVKN